MSKKFLLLIVVALAVFGAGLLLQFNSFGSQAIWNFSREGQWLLPLVLLTSLVDSINPCSFSVLLLTIAFLFSIGKFRSNVFKLGLIYILGIFVVYMGIGLGLLQILHVFNTPHFMAKVGAVLLVFLGGLNLVNYFFPAFPIKLKIPSFAHKKIGGLMEAASVPAVFGLGALVGLCEFPCTGGPYLTVLGLLHDRQTYSEGVLYLVLYNLMFILPLVIILTLASSRELFDRVKNWQRTESKNMRLYGGVATVILGLLIYYL